MKIRTFVIGFMAYCILLLAERAAAVLDAPSNGDNASGVANASPVPRKIQFSGFEWWVKSSENGGKPVGPGPNYFSSESENVWVADDGRLYLRATHQGSRWYCAEVVSSKSFGFGTYRFYVDTPPGKIDPNLVLGLFTWSDRSAYAHREIDVEVSRWMKGEDTNNAQFVVQPYRFPGHMLRFPVSPDTLNTTYSFTWESNRVGFLALSRFTKVASAQKPLVREWEFKKQGIPQPGDENVRINLWLVGGMDPVDADDTVVIIKKFEFEPLPRVGPEANQPSVGTPETR